MAQQAAEQCIKPSEDADHLDGWSTIRKQCCRPTIRTWRHSSGKTGVLGTRLNGAPGDGWLVRTAMVNAKAKMRGFFPSAGSGSE